MNITMKKYVLIVVFIGSQLLFVLLHIDKQNRFIAYTYRRQEMERVLQQKEQELHVAERVFFEQTDLARIKEYAQNELHMQNAKINQFRSIETITIL
jgi:hypothetical protein